MGGDSRVWYHDMDGEKVVRLTEVPFYRHHTVSYDDGEFFCCCALPYPVQDYNFPAGG